MRKGATEALMIVRNGGVCRKLAGKPHEAHIVNITNP